MPSKQGDDNATPLLRETTATGVENRRGAVSTSATPLLLETSTLETHRDLRAAGQRHGRSSSPALLQQDVHRRSPQDEVEQRRRTRSASTQRIASSSPPLLLSGPTPQKQLQQHSRRTSRSTSRDSSPDALTSNSETTRRSCHLWQQQLLSNGTPVTQHLGSRASESGATPVPLMQSPHGISLSSTALEEQEVVLLSLSSRHSSPPPPHRVTTSATPSPSTTTTAWPAGPSATAKVTPLAAVDPFPSSPPARPVTDQIHHGGNGGVRATSGHLRLGGGSGSSTRQSPALITAVSNGTATTPQLLDETACDSPPVQRLREPPAWRSPQAGEVPRTLQMAPVVATAAVSPSSSSRPPSPPLAPASRSPSRCTTQSVDCASTIRIARAANIRPAVAPATMWICLDDDEAEEVERGDSAEREASADTAKRAGGGEAEEASPSVAALQLPHRRPLEKSTIADLLPPTFRPRRRTPRPSPSRRSGGWSHPSCAVWEPSLKAPSASSGPLQYPYVVLDDSSSNDDEDRDASSNDENDTPLQYLAPNGGVQQKAAIDRRAPIASSITAIAAAAALRGADGRLGMSVILDDNDEDEGNADGVAVGPPEKRRRIEPSPSAPARPPPFQLDHDPPLDCHGLRSPLNPCVRDYLFPRRLVPELRPCSLLHQSIVAYRQRSGRGAAKSKVSSGSNTPLSSSLRPNSALPLKTNGHDTTVGSEAAEEEAPHGHRQASPPLRSSSLPWGRPADLLLTDFFPKRRTRGVFMSTAKRVIPPEHFLAPGHFWAAFQSAEYIGEGSFGIVWRCRTIDGDLVAVKSCPVSLRSKASIEDSLSAIREVATMRFLNEMQVPYVLPLHSAFFTTAREALPPPAHEALQWRARLRKKAEAAALELQVQELSSGRRLSAAKVQKGCRSADALADKVKTALQKMAAAEGPKAKAQRAELEAVKLPRFLSITEEDLAMSDGTVFLVMELCDGDVEAVARRDGIAKGVAFCVSSALAAMHELGLLHLDLKPSNILYAYEHGPSQQPQPSRTSTPTTDAVKFYISDFGNCQLVGPAPLDRVEEVYGTFEYMDLLALRDAVCGRSTDAFSLGASLYDLLFGRHVYPPCQNPACQDEEDHTRECFVEAASRPILGLDAASTSSASGPASTSSALLQLTAALLQPRWEDRMTMEECRRFLVKTFAITQTGYDTPPISHRVGELRADEEKDPC